MVMATVSLPEHMRPAAVALLDGYRAGPEFRFELDHVDDAALRFRLVEEAPDGSEVRRSTLSLYHRSQVVQGARTSKSFVLVPGEAPTPAIAAALQAGVERPRAP